MWRLFVLLALAGCANDAERGPGAGPACRYLAMCVRPVAMAQPVYVVVPSWSPPAAYAAPTVRARIPCDMRGLATSGIANTLTDCY